MSAELQLKEYLDNSTESSKRIRTILTILVVVTVLILAGFLNSWIGFAWNRERISFYQNYIEELNLRIKELNGFNEGQPKHLLPLLEQLPPHYGSEECAKAINQIQCYEGARWLSQKFLEESVNAYVGNSYLVRVPFFGVAFDINDLGAIGGLSLIVILIMLRLNLRNFIVSLRVGFKAARKANSYDNFYDILAGRQLFAFPALEDPRQDAYQGRTEAIWSVSTVRAFYARIIMVFSGPFFGIKKALWAMLKIFLLSSHEEFDSDPKQDYVSKKNGWHSNPHPLLALVPTWICLVPAIVYAGMVINDFQSYEIGFVVNGTRTVISLSFSLVCLVVIFGLGCWCISKWIEIDRLWKQFSPTTSVSLSAIHHLETNPQDPHLREELIRLGWLSYGKMLGPFVLILIFAIIQAIRFGVAQGDYVLLIIGSIISIMAGTLYYVDIRMPAKSSNRWALSFWVGPIGILTYLFSVYLFFYRGLWTLSSLTNDFSYRPILVTTVFVGFSLYALQQFQRLTEVERMHRSICPTPPDESCIKTTMNKWMQQEAPSEQVQTIGLVFSKSDTECETTITSTTEWQWKATFRRSGEGTWYLATVFMYGRQYEPNLEVK